MMTKRFFIATFFSVLCTILILSGIPKTALAEKGVLGDGSWTVEEKVGRLSYITHGAFVWGHEFGFVKGKDNCESDIVWLSFSARDAKVKDFVGKTATVLLDIDGETLKIELDVIFTGVIGFTQVMYFSNWLAGEQLMAALAKGRYVEVRIVEPKELEKLLDIKYDKFGLAGFTTSRNEATNACRVQLPNEEKDSLASLPLAGCGD